MQVNIHEGAEKRKEHGRKDKKKRQPLSSGIIKHKYPQENPKDDFQHKDDGIKLITVQQRIVGNAVCIGTFNRQPEQIVNEHENGAVVAFVFHQGIRICAGQDLDQQKKQYKDFRHKDQLLPVTQEMPQTVSIFPKIF